MEINIVEDMLRKVSNIFHHELTYVKGRLNTRNGLLIFSFVVLLSLSTTTLILSRSNYQVSNPQSSNTALVIPQYDNQAEYCAIQDPSMNCVFNSITNICECNPGAQQNSGGNIPPVNNSNPGTSGGGQCTYDTSSQCQAAGCTWSGYPTCGCNCNVASNPGSGGSNPPSGNSGSGGTSPGCNSGETMIGNTMCCTTPSSCRSIQVGPGQSYPTLGAGPQPYWDPSKQAYVTPGNGNTPNTPVINQPNNPPAASGPCANTTNRNSCSAIRGTEYCSIAERTWYLANCIITVTPSVTKEALRELGKVCNNNSQCASNQCLLGVCSPLVPPKSNGMECDDKSECASGYCYYARLGDPGTCQSGPATVPDTSCVYQVFDPSINGYKCVKTNTASSAVAPQEIRTSFTLNTPGLGSSTDLGQNANPVRTQDIEFQILDAQNNILKQGKISSAKSTSGQAVNLTGVVSFGTDLPAGNHAVKLKLDNTLWKKINTNLATGTLTNIPSVELTAGDLNKSNSLDLLDYNIFISCFGDKSCTQKQISDLNLDGKVNEVDLNIFYSGLQNRNGD